MRIGIYTEIYRPVLNGVVVSVESFREQLQALGHEVYIFAPAYMAYDEPFVLPFHSLPLPTHTPYRLATPFRKQGHVPELDVIHAQTPFMTGLLAWNHARRIDVPLVFTYHTRLEDYHHYLPLSPVLSRSLMVWVSRTFSNMSDRVVVPGASVKALLESYGVTTPIDVVPTDVRLRPASPEAAAEVRGMLGIPGTHRVLLYVGRLAREKNLGTLLDAFVQARTPDLHLVLVGDGPLRPWLESEIEARALQSVVHLAGAVDHAQIPAWYRAADLFVFTSVTETQGLVVEEALQVGLPTLAIGAGGVIDAVGRWPGGRLVPMVEDPLHMTEAYTAALREVVSGATLSKMRHDAQTNAKADAADSIATARLIAVYEAAIQTRQSDGPSNGGRFHLSQR